MEISLSILADILGTSKRTVESLDARGALEPFKNPANGKISVTKKLVKQFPELQFFFSSEWRKETKIKPVRPYSLIELFAGAGGLALGLEKAGFKSVLLNDFDKDACETLSSNRPRWNVIHSDISNIDFSDYKGEIDVITGGFPCQAFSYAGNKMGFEDTRGTLFYQFARAVKETNPKVFMAENVRGLLSHDGGRTLSTILSVIEDIGYDVVDPILMKAIFHRVPQKRERLFIVGIRKDVSAFVDFISPSKYPRIFTLREALKKGALFRSDVPKSTGQTYPQRKAEIMKQVPQGGYWKDLPDGLQREFMKGSYFLGGGKTGLARRLSWDEPSLTLTTAPAQGQTERCHPEETRPLTIAEYARIQTFPDSWEFSGSTNSIYKQIGNAVPVNLGHAMGRALVRLLNDIEGIKKNGNKKMVKRGAKGQGKLSF